MAHLAIEHEEQEPSGYTQQPLLASESPLASEFRLAHQISPKRAMKGTSCQELRCCSALRRSSTGTNATRHTQA